MLFEWEWNIIKSHGEKEPPPCFFQVIMLLKTKTPKQMDMLHGSMMKNILWFALPLALSGLIQQLFTSADMAIVFWFDKNSTTAQAAVNSNGALINLIINLFSGMSVGSTVLIAELIGKNKKDDIHSVVLTSLVMAAVSGVVLLGLGIGVAQPLLTVMGTPETVKPLATVYLRIYFIGMPFFMVYNFGAAILRSLGDTKTAVFILLITGVINVGLNILFVAAFDMSVAGVAIATVVSNLLSAVMVVILIMRYDMLRPKRGQSKIRKEYIKKIIVVGMPAGLQGMVFSLANIFVQAAVNGFGDAAMAGNGDAINFEMYSYYFVNGFVQAAITFIGQNYAAGEYERCRRIFKLTFLSAVVVSAVLSIAFSAGAKLFIRIYTNDPDVIYYALIRMWCVCSSLVIACAYEIPGGALRGLGHSLLPAVLTVIGSCVFRIIWIYTVFLFYHSYWMLVIIYPISWALTGAAVMISYLVLSRRAYCKPKPEAEDSEAEENAEASEQSPIS